MVGGRRLGWRPFALRLEAIALRLEAIALEVGGRRS